MSLPVYLLVQQLIICVCVTVIIAACVYFVKWIAKKAGKKYE